MVSPELHRTGAEHRRRAKSGTVTVLVALSVPALLGILGLAIDVGLFLGEKHRLQGAADMMAMAGAYELRRGNVDGYRDAALINGRENGVLDEGPMHVDVVSPPREGLYAGAPDFVEVSVEHELRPYFMFGLTNPTIAPAVRSVAGLLPPPTCVFAIDPTTSGALRINGNGAVRVECAVHVDSAAPNAAVLGNGSKLESGEIRIVGDYVGVGINPTPITGVPAAGDPIGAMPRPEIGNCTSKQLLQIEGDTTLSPGVYCGGISITQGTVSLRSGTYVFVGRGLKVAGSASVVGEEVTFYHTATSSQPYSPSVIEGQPSVVLTAPTSGSWQGILYFQDRDAFGARPTDVNRLRAGAKLRGLLYFPTTTVSLLAEAESGAAEVIIVANSVVLSGGTTIRPYVGPVPRALSEVQIVE